MKRERECVGAWLVDSKGVCHAQGLDHGCLDKLATWLKLEYFDKRRVAVEPVTWPRYFPKIIPQQRNMVDCGVFMILFADYVVRALC